jgi:hypothetical protein
MDNRRAAFIAAAARLDAFLERAVEEFGHNAQDPAETNRRIEAHIKAQARKVACDAGPSRPTQPPELEWWAAA